MHDDAHVPPARIARAARHGRRYRYLVASGRYAPVAPANRSPVDRPQDRPQALRAAPTAAGTSKNDALHRRLVRGGSGAAEARYSADRDFIVRAQRRLRFEVAFGGTDWVGV